MDAERRQHNLPHKAVRHWGFAAVPRWYLQFRLNRLTLDIDRLERQLAQEHGTLDTAPMHAELAALRSEREALLARLNTQA